MRTFKVRLLSVFLLACLLAALPPSPARAASRIFRVSPTPFFSRICGGSWTQTCGLIHAMNTALPGDQIWVKAGTYKPTTGTDRTVSFIPKNGVAIYGGFAGNETAEEQRDPVANLTILSGDIGVQRDKSDNSYRVVLAQQVDDTTILDGFTITDGYADGSPGTDYSFGAGMFVRISSSPMLANLVFRENEAVKDSYGGGGYGGGLYNEGNPILTDVTFHANLGSLGGGMSSFAGNPTLQNVTFSENQSTGGGGLFIADGSPTLTNVTFGGNVTVAQGAGMYNYDGSPVLTYVTFSGNQATDTYYGRGSAIYDELGSVVLSNSIVWGNTAPTGPQIYNAGSAPTTINSSVVQGGCPAGSTCSNIITDNPRLATLGSNGGLTQTMPLLPGSSALDIVSPRICPPTDQRGVPRPQGRRCDLGAYEVLDPVREGTYDDSHPAWVYDGEWTVSTRMGAYHNTLHRTQTMDSYAYVTFDGVQVVLAYWTGPLYGSFDVYIDRDKVDTVNANTLTSAPGIWTSTLLSAGVHNVSFIARSRRGIELDGIHIVASDVLPPGDVTGLVASSGSSEGSVLLTWTDPPDDAGNNASGPVGTYLVKYSTVPFASWNEGIAVTTGLPVPVTPGTTQTMSVEGLNPGTRYYFVIRAQDEQGNLSLNYAAADAIATASSVIGPGTYDDTHPAWVYTGAWTPHSETGPYNNTLHYTNVQSASAAITFQGTRFTLYFTKYPNRGNVEVWIDGVLQYTFNEYGSVLAWQQTWSVPVSLPAGVHTVEFRNPSASTYIDIDAITIIP
jgi:hypothetical protein